MAEIEIRRKKDSRGALTLPSVSVSYPHVLDPGSEKFKKKKISTEFQNIFYKYTVSLKNVLAYLDKIKEQQFCIAKKDLLLAFQLSLHVRNGFYCFFTSWIRIYILLADLKHYRYCLLARLTVSYAKSF